MRILLDTHFVQRLVAEPTKISRSEHALMSRNDLVVSSVSIWEFRIKWDKHGGMRRRDLLDPHKALQFVIDNEMELAPLTGTDCAASLDVAIDHHDPFDVMLLVHAQCLGARLLTRDTRLLDHPLAISA
ncbi:type II toxin-antitoxin system VapC family toxin [Sphingomonas hylomeconis]|uniref:Type II toxin-antitoxin system VapC family toxin n=1 Tax=Sphingomonas hylomeconis TaxID=1395958 RepID=A0ABV7STK1_9SPHN|nr:PIN domain-containing protein [Sphingomonas hylomeconis]